MRNFRTGWLTPGFDPQERCTAEVLARWAVELYDAPGIGATAETVLDFALQALSCDYAGLALTTRAGQASVGAVTDELVAELYQGQICAGDGPLFEVLARSADLHIPEIIRDDRWPVWAAKATDSGIQAVLHVPLIGPGRAIGVLSAFNTKPRSFSADDEATAHLLALHAAVAVADAQHTTNMMAAVDARKTVGQATGILMERFDVDADRAFAILKRYSQDTNTKIRDLAQQLIDNRTLPPYHLSRT